MISMCGAQGDARVGDGRTEAADQVRGSLLGALWALYKAW